VWAKERVHTAACPLEIRHSKQNKIIEKGMDLDASRNICHIYGMGLVDKEQDR
jgi:hypothetical protein